MSASLVTQYEHKTFNINVVMAPCIHSRDWYILKFLLLLFRFIPCLYWTHRYHRHRLIEKNLLVGYPFTFMKKKDTIDVITKLVQSDNDTVCYNKNLTPANGHADILQSEVFVSYQSVNIQGRADTL